MVADFSFKALEVYSFKTLPYGTAQFSPKLVHQLFAVACENESSTWTTQSFVCSRSNDIKTQNNYCWIFCLP